MIRRLGQISWTIGVIAASSALRAQLRPCHRYTFLTTCWLSVEALREELRLRPVAQDELDEMRRVCNYMAESAATTSVSVDDYFLEFGSGDGDPQTIPEDKRFAFVFTRERGCAADPTPASLK